MFIIEALEIHGSLATNRHNEVTLERKLNSLMAAAKKAAKKPVSKAPETETPGVKKKRGRSSLTIVVPITRSTLLLLEACVTLNQATSPEAVAAKLLARAADDLRTAMSTQLAGSFGSKEKA